jgi:hypothetical protein
MTESEQVETRETRRMELELLVDAIAVALVDREDVRRALGYEERQRRRDDYAESLDRLADALHNAVCAAAPQPTGDRTDV